MEGGEKRYLRPDMSLYRLLIHSLLFLSAKQRDSNGK